MAWLKQVLIDVVVTLLVVAATILDQAWARWIVLIYTPLMLILKIVVLLGSQSLGKLKRKKEEVPVWVYHVLYAVNVLLTALDQWWLVAGGWALIWILSIATDLRMRPAATG